MVIFSCTLWPALHDMQYADVWQADCVHIVMEGTDVKQHADTHVRFHCCRKDRMWLPVSLEHVVAIAVFVRASDDAISRASLVVVLRVPQ